MYKNNSELTGISFNMGKDEYQNTYCNEPIYQWEDECSCEEGRLNLVLAVSHEVIEDISAKDEIIYINNEEDIKRDIFIERKKYYRLYGRVIDNKGIAYKDVLVRVYKYIFGCGNIEREELDKMLTNECGEFNFLIRVEKESNLESYKAEIDSYYKML